MTASVLTSGRSGVEIRFPMPSRDLQETSQDTLVSSAWESTPWVPEERVVLEMKSDGPPLHLSDDNVIELTESESLRKTV